MNYSTNIEPSKEVTLKELDRGQTFMQDNHSRTVFIKLEGNSYCSLGGSMYEDESEDEVCYLVKPEKPITFIRTQRKE